MNEEERLKKEQQKLEKILNTHEKLFKDYSGFPETDRNEITGEFAENVHSIQSAIAKYLKAAEKRGYRIFAKEVLINFFEEVVEILKGQ